jgi:hypothetical protein
MMQKGQEKLKKYFLEQDAPLFSSGFASKLFFGKITPLMAT